MYMIIEVNERLPILNKKNRGKAVIPDDLFYLGMCVGHVDVPFKYSPTQDD